MAAYGALVSLMHIIDTLEKHPSPPISIQKKQVQSLTENVTHFQNFLDADAYTTPVSDNHEANPLERRIAVAVYAAEDIIESHIVDQIDNRSTMVGKMINFSINFFRGLCRCITIDGFHHDLQQVIEELNMIRKEAQEFAPKAKVQRNACSADFAAGPLTSSSTVKHNMMVGFDQVSIEVLEKLNDNQSIRQIILITGMAGIGKTTLARNLFELKLVKEQFDVHVWIKISQTYDVREILGEVYNQACGHSQGLNEIEKLSEQELGVKLYQSLYGRRYIIIMDDMWNIEVWNKVQMFFPDNENRSRIMVTTRESYLTSMFNKPCRVDMNFLNDSSGWELFCNTVFGGESCPLELDSIGKNIVSKCKGLPLSIVTIGCLLAKSVRTREFWKSIEQNLNSIVIKYSDEFCFKILMMSYTNLPNYLKPCLMYTSVFKKGRSIRVSMLKKLWVSEGFIKSERGKCLETIAQEYFTELVDRNLILVDQLGSIGNVKYCKIHDLLRAMCLREVEKERFYHVVRDDSLGINSERRVVFPSARLLTNEVLGSLSHARSIICDYGNNKEVRLPRNLRLMRTFKACDASIAHWKRDAYFLENLFQFVNSRYLAVRVHDDSKFSSSVDLLWNLHTLIISCSGVLIAPTEIWKLHQLQCLEVEQAKLSLPDPPSGENDTVIMENLHTLKGVKNLNLNENVVKRIPNVKKLHLTYDLKQMEGENCLSYLQYLSKLRNLSCYTDHGCGDYLQRIEFPKSLEKLLVDASSYRELDDLLEKIGSLPLLEKFVLVHGFFKTGKWETIEDHFPSLKFLELKLCGGLKEWIVSDSSHFPLLQKVCLRFLIKLKEIPSEIGNIATMKLISLIHCTEAAMVSTKMIEAEQMDYGTMWVPKTPSSSS